MNDNMPSPGLPVEALDEADTVTADSDISHLLFWYLLQDSDFQTMCPDLDT